MHHPQRLGRLGEHLATTATLEHTYTVSVLGYVGCIQTMCDNAGLNWGLLAMHTIMISGCGTPEALTLPSDDLVGVGTTQY